MPTLRTMFCALVVSLVTPAWADSTDALYALARESAAKNLDCPMTPEQARQLGQRTPQRQSYEVSIAEALSCACDVDIRGGIAYRNPDCHIDLAQRSFQQGYTHAHINELAARARASGARTMKAAEQMSPDARAVMVWADRLAAKSKDENPNALSRPRPIDQALDARAYVGELEGQTPTYTAFAKSADSIQQDIKGRNWGGLNDQLKKLRELLTKHEQLTLNGKQSPAGRARLAATEANVKAHSRQIDCVDRVYNGPEYKRLTGAESNLNEKIRAFKEHKPTRAREAACGTQFADAEFCGMVKQRDSLMERSSRLQIHCDSR